MYAVVGCSECSALWVIEEGSETTGCPRCGRRHRTDRLRRFVETDDRNRARQARAAMLADRSDEEDAFADLDDFGTLEARIDDAGVDDATYLEAADVDRDAVEEAGERASRGRGGGESRQETVLSALRELDRPTEAEVVAYADERGVPGEYARKTLSKLARNGEVIERDGQYRPL